jgi:hypothetical protein
VFDSGVDYCSGGKDWSRIDICAWASTDCYWGDNGATSDTVNEDCDEAYGLYLDRSTSASCSGGDCVACPTSCTLDSHCDASAHCDGTCIADVGMGVVCDEDSDCSSGNCETDWDSSVGYCTSTTQCINGAGDNRYANGYELCSGDSWYKSCGSGGAWGGQSNCDTSIDYQTCDSGCGWQSILVSQFD